MFPRILVLIGLTLIALCAALAADTPNTDQLLVIYDGTASLPDKITMGDWGFIPRPVKPTDSPFTPLKLGSKWYALKVTSVGRYQGARFDFKMPIDTTPFAGVKNTYLQLCLRATDDKKTTPEGAGGETYSSAAITNPMKPDEVHPMPGPMPGPDGAVPPPVPDGGPGVPNDTLPVEMQPEKVKPRVNPMPSFKNLRFTFMTEKGPALLEVKPEMLHPEDEGKWVRVEVPLSLLNANLPLGTKLSRLIIASDEPTEMYIGRIVVLRDNAPFKVSVFGPFPTFVEAGQRSFFAARVETGLSQYEVQWNFDTKAGAKVDAVGERITHVYDTEGTYVVTCTVRDLNGGKEPVSETIELKVSRAQGN